MVIFLVKKSLLTVVNVSLRKCFLHLHLADTFGEFDEKNVCLDFLLSFSLNRF
jgi:hypothetical protein